MITFYKRILHLNNSMAIYPINYHRIRRKNPPGLVSKVKLAISSEATTPKGILTSIGGRGGIRTHEPVRTT